MIDIVIPLGLGSRWQNNEIQYCLRGIEKYAINFRNIYLIGEKPEFFNEGSLTHRLIHHPFTDKYNHEKSIYEKIKFACLLPDVSDNFFFMNDDHFILKEIDIETYPYYFNSTLTEKITNRARNDGYCISMRNTRDVLSPFENETYFDIHTPIIYNKTKFIKSVGGLDWSKGMGYVIKTCYCNLNGITGIQFKDLKIKNNRSLDYLKNKILDRHVFSIADSAINSEFEIFMNELYPNKSKFEKTVFEMTKPKRKRHYESRRW